MQSERILGLDTPLAKDELILSQFTGCESISKPFWFKLHMFSTNNSIKAQELIGKPISFHVNRHGDPIRHFHGIVNKFYVGLKRSDKIQEYIAEVVPWFWFLTCTNNSRTFQNLNIKEIMKQIFTEYHYTDYLLNNLKEEYKPRHYCVQYNETTFNFIARLLEEEGICYFFKHYKDKHVLVFADRNSGFNKDNLAVTYKPESYSIDCINDWKHGYSFRSGRTVYNSYDFENPQKDMLNSAETSHELSFEKKYELYNFVDSGISKVDPRMQAKLIIESESANIESINGKSTCPAFMPGNNFKIVDGELKSENIYIITAVQHQAFDLTHYSMEMKELDRSIKKSYENNFSCIPSQITYRPPRLTPKPTIHGIQTAVVVGPKGEEIYTDKYGRVKIRFYWDRDGKKRNESSSCWVRYMQNWTGKRWGSLFLPRVGQEVMVSFIDGDPDQPIVVGGIYNFDQMPPYVLPQNKTQTGIKTNSSKDGQTDEANELRFEDKKGDEQIYLHAQKDWLSIVENDQVSQVKNNQNINIENDRQITVDKGNDTKIVKSGNNILKITQGNQETKISSGKQTVEAMRSIEFKVGSNSIVIDQIGIHFKGVKIDINGALIQVKSDSCLKLEGVFIEGNGSGIIKLQGGLVMIN